MEEKRNGTTPRLAREEAERRHLLSEETLTRMHLRPQGAPVATVRTEDGREIAYYSPDRVREAPPQEWYVKRRKSAEKEKIRPAKNADGSLPRLGIRRAAQLGCFTLTALHEMYYEPDGEPVAYCVRHDGTEEMLYDRDECHRLPLPCVCCGATPRYRRKLCRACYEKDLAERRAEGDAKRAAYYGYDRARVLYFDLEMTGVYEHDEVLSVSVIDGNGDTVIDTLTRPVRTKRWKRTEAIHGITPEMVKDAPAFEELMPRLREIFNGADRMIAYGTNTDFFHLRRVYATHAERDALREKIIDCAAEFSHYAAEHEIELTHFSLSDAMSTLSLTWDGIAHTATADAAACRLVFETLFPHYYEEEGE